jgi:transcriptional regulator with XRE-family HTH domain
MPRREVDWFGPRLKAAREARGLTQAQLGEKVSLAASQVNKLEIGVSQPLVATALDLARALEVSILELIPEDGPTMLREGPDPTRRGNPSYRPKHDGPGRPKKPAKAKKVKRTTGRPRKGK